MNKARRERKKARRLPAAEISREPETPETRDVTVTAGVASASSAVNPDEDRD